MRYTSLTATISHDNKHHRTSKHASTSWRSDGSPSCLGGSSHGWVPVNPHSTPVPTSVGRLWVAHQQHTSVTTQRAHMTTRGGHCFLFFSFVFFFFFSFFFFFFFCRGLKICFFFLASISLRFLVTIFLKKQFVGPSRERRSFSFFFLLFLLLVSFF